MTGFDWRLSAACTTKTADEFFPLAYGSDHTKAAKALCAVCPVSTRCLEWAVDTQVTDGVWGGWTVAERRRRDVGPVRPPRPPAEARTKPEHPRGPYKPYCACGRLKTEGRNRRWICQPCVTDKTRRWREAQAVPA